jgi:hypothetical protein
VRGSTGEGIPPTAEWMAEINAAIEAADSFVVIMTPDSMNSKVCGEEISHALAHNERIVPVVRRDLNGGSTRREVASLNWIFFREQDDFGGSVDTLVHALETDLEWVRVHTRLLVRGREWQSSGRDRGSLLRGRDLEKAEQWMSQAAQHKEPTPTALHGEYINASRRATTQAQRRRLSFVASALVVALGLAAVAVIQRIEAIDQRNRADRRATIANSRAVAVQALSSMEGRLDLGILLATEAFSIAPTSEAVDALHIAAQRSIWIDRAIRHEDEVNSIAYNADGCVLARPARTGPSICGTGRVGSGSESLSLTSQDQFHLSPSTPAETFSPRVETMEPSSCGTRRPEAASGASRPPLLRS